MTWGLFLFFCTATEMDSLFPFEISLTWWDWKLEIVAARGKSDERLGLW
jgi:hypothetical protein